MNPSDNTMQNPNLGQSQPLLKITDLHQRFVQNRFSKKNMVHALNGVSLELHPGETLGIVGETGCGKSTLCRTLMGLQRPWSGSITLDGQDITRPSREHGRLMRRSMQMVFQDPADSMNPRLNVGSIIAEPLVIQTGKGEEHHRPLIQDLLRDVGMPADILERYPHEFSGGQRQRIAIARSLVLKPRILVCDEPVSALDVSVQAQILNLLLDMQAEHALAMIFVSHALSVVRHMSDRIAVMYLGTIVEEGTSGELYSNPAHPYTRRLMESHPGLEEVIDPVESPAKAADSAIHSPTAPESGRSPVNQPGRELPDNLEPPSPVNIPVGCPYQSACPLADRICMETRPQLRSMGANHRVACHKV